MPPRILPSDSSSTAKRARSADHSSSATPVNEEAENFDDSALPPFLRLSKAEISARFEDLNSKQLARFEHHRLNRDSESPWAQEASHNARLRNRYFDIRPWDKTRVRLRVSEGRSDYINASSIVLKCSVTGLERRYIATQGPKESSVDHFWQMVWHETNEVAVIVMLTQLTEGFREKCIQYFPDNVESDPLELVFSDEEGEDDEATVELKESVYDDVAKTTVRTLQLSYKSQKKTVFHLFFLGWPDYGVPVDLNRSALLELIKLSRNKNNGWTNPRIVHCSAGVGRSGTFIALEHLLAELEMGLMDGLDNDKLLKESTITSPIDHIYETVDSLRQQRMTMVQSEAQFEFLYDLLAEAARTRIKEAFIASKVQASLSYRTELLSPSGEPVHKAMRFSRSFKNIISTLRDRSVPRRTLTSERGNDVEVDVVAQELEVIGPREENERLRVVDGLSSLSATSELVEAPDTKMQDDDSQTQNVKFDSEPPQLMHIPLSSDESQLPDALPPLPGSSSEDEDEVETKREKDGQQNQL